MEQLDPLPTAGAVLNKLKSDGTFDQFRKTCLAAIEAEDYKCKSDTTKNQLRVKLRDYAVSVFGNPELQVGMPLAALVEKALESKAKDLLPKIQEAVEALRDAKPSAGTSSDPSPSTSSAVVTTEEMAGSSQSSKTPADFTSLPLPIDIPGLNVTATKKEQTSGGAVGEGKQSGNKVKPKASDGCKEGTKPATTKAKTIKVKDRDTLVEDSNNKDKSKTTKVEERIKVAKPKEKDSAMDEKEKIRAAKLKDEDGNRDKKVKSSVKIKKLKDDKEPISKDDSEKEKPTKTAKDSADISTVKESKQTDTDATKTEQTIEQKEPNSSEIKPDRDESAQETAVTRGARKRKGSVPMRRSARLASHSSETKENEQKTNSDFEDSASERERENEAVTMTTLSASSGKREAKRSSNRKRTRIMISSSSSAEDSDQEESNEGQSTPEDETARKKYKPENKHSRQPKRARDLAEPTVDQNPMKKVKKGQKRTNQHDSSKKKRKLRMTSPVLVLTRYNRTVRPNPKYLPSEETQSSEDSKPDSPVTDVEAASSPRSSLGEATRSTNRPRK